MVDSAPGLITPEFYKSTVPVSLESWLIHKGMSAREAQRRREFLMRFSDEQLVHSLGAPLHIGVTSKRTQYGGLYVFFGILCHNQDLRDELANSQRDNRVIDLFDASVKSQFGFDTSIQLEFATNREVPLSSFVRALRQYCREDDRVYHGMVHYPAFTSVV